MSDDHLRDAWVVQVQMWVSLLDDIKLCKSHRTLYHHEQRKQLVFKRLGHDESIEQHELDRKQSDCPPREDVVFEDRLGFFGAYCLLYHQQDAFNELDEEE